MLVPVVASVPAVASPEVEFVLAPNVDAFWGTLRVDAVSRFGAALAAGGALWFVFKTFAELTQIIADMLLPQ